ncbi:MAG: hypothetical protein LC748_04390 [Thermomicrobia bacterium]|nr:hypothetical protein [Thermomicrobia bacterium]
MDGRVLPIAALFSRYYGSDAGKGHIEMEIPKVRAGFRAFGRAILQPLCDVERTVEFAAHWQQHLIRTDALPETRRERRGTR